MDINELRGLLEPSAQDQSNALSMGLLNLGSGLLANSRGHYGQFAPAWGQGLQAGLHGYQSGLQGARNSRIQDIELRLKLAEMEKKQQAEQRAQEVLGTLTPEQQKIYALGGGDVLAKSMLPQKEEPIAIVKEMRAAGISENSPEGQRILRNRLMKPEGGMEAQRGQIIFDNEGRAFNVNPYTNSVRPVSIGGQQIQGAQYSPLLQGQISGAKASGKETGQATGEATAKLQDIEAMMPRLETVVSELSTLGKKATYTMAGQGVDATRRQLGMKVGEGAIARKEYISKVDNEILPLLRQTFGAQFTQKEGESLKATLGDPNASPEEKDAVLRSFIDTKYGQIAGLKVRAGGTLPAAATSPSNRVRKFNPATGRIE